MFGDVIRMRTRNVKGVRYESARRREMVSSP